MLLAPLPVTRSLPVPALKFSMTVSDMMVRFDRPPQTLEEAPPTRLTTWLRVSAAKLMVSIPARSQIVMPLLDMFWA